MRARMEDKETAAAAARALECGRFGKWEERRGEWARARVVRGGAQGACSSLIVVMMYLSAISSSS
jgi:hypothetical protein